MADNDANNSVWTGPFSAALCYFQAAAGTVAENHFDHDVCSLPLGDFVFQRKGNKENNCADEYNGRAGCSLRIVCLLYTSIPAGKATPAPPVGPALGQHGVNIMAFTKEFNERTKNDAGLILSLIHILHLTYLGPCLSYCDIHFISACKAGVDVQRIAEADFPAVLLQVAPNEVCKNPDHQITKAGVIIAEVAPPAFENQAGLASSAPDEGDTLVPFHFDGGDGAVHTLSLIHILILSTKKSDRVAAVSKLLPYQKGDFKGRFRLRRHRFSFG